MSKANLIAGLDIGSSTTKLLLAKEKKEDSGLEAVYFIEMPSSGVRKGVVISPDKVSGIISNLVDKIKAETGQRVNSVFASINGSHIFTTFSRGTVAVSRADQRISEEDVERLLQAAKTFSLPLNNEILEIFPKEFIIDGQAGIKEIVGLKGVRLETEVLVLASFAPYKNNLNQAISNADLQIADIIPSALAAADAVLTPQQKELGVALLDIGAGTTNLAVFEEGILTHLSVFPMGSANITNDIAVGLKTDVDTAEAIKNKIGSCSSKSGQKKEKIEAEGEEILIFSQKTLNKIITARVAEILGEVKKKLKEIGKSGLLPGGVVLTGGGAKLPYLVELAKKELKLPCRIGKPLNFSGLEADPALATICGLVLRGANLTNEESWLGQSFSSSQLKDKVKNFFKIFIP